MKTAAECLEYAAKCEEMARNVWRDSFRQSLLQAAACWRRLAASATPLRSPEIKGWLPSAPDKAASPLASAHDIRHDFGAIVSSIRTVERLLQRQLSADRRARVQALFELLLGMQRQALLKSSQATTH